MRKVSKIQIAVVIEPMCIKEEFIPKYTCQFYLIKFSTYFKTSKFENPNSHLIQKSSTKHKVRTMNVEVCEKKQVAALQLLKFVLAQVRITNSYTSTIH